jgi:[ribosomal protein S5]-alanine N-acetyltransferase
MLGLSLFHGAGPVLEGRRVSMRMPRITDHRAWADLRRESSDFLRPWEPRWTADEFDRGAWRERIRRYRREHANGTATSFLIFEKDTRQLLGGITLGNIRYGVAQCGQIGYWMGERFAGQGYMQESIALLLDHAFGRLRLHRVEAACIPSNARSVRVLENAGFTREGVLRSYLKINGSWEDHLLYALIDEDHRARGGQGKKGIFS